MGFRDGYTAVPYRGKMAADGPRYKAIGNSIAGTVLAWLGQRIRESLAKAEGAA
jgi:DNA (cytosine-5)-methyltransferase 1